MNGKAMVGSAAFFGFIINDLWGVIFEGASLDFLVGNLKAPIVAFTAMVLHSMWQKHVDRNNDGIPDVVQTRPATSEERAF